MKQPKPRILLTQHTVTPLTKKFLAQGSYVTMDAFQKAGTYPLVLQNRGDTPSVFAKSS